tara:strand:- start:297 stop:410 length:114 start_codon:yes stop_codon:yes gene_type:complete
MRYCFPFSLASLEAAREAIDISAAFIIGRLAGDADRP